MGMISNSSLPPRSAEKPTALRFDKVSFSYGKVKVLENVSFHILQNEFAALTGPNGSGKTTALKLLLGLETPQSGRIELFDRSSPRIRERVGYVPQQVQFDRAFPITAGEVVKMGRLNPLSRSFGLRDKQAVEYALEQAEITELVLRPYASLSGGQRRRVLVARALASLGPLAGDSTLPVKEPALLVLDEPTANMDAESEGRFFVTLEKLKGSITILIVTHDRYFVSSLVDRVLCMDNDNRYGKDVSVVRCPPEASTDVSSDSRILREENFFGNSRCPKNGSPRKSQKKVKNGFL